MHELANFFGGSTPLKRIAVYARLYARFSTIPRQAVLIGMGRERRGGKKGQHSIVGVCIDIIDRSLRDEI